jgi:DNA-binding PucR family transcriptional regulator
VEHAASDDGVLSLRQLLEYHSLGLTLVTGADALSRPVRWAHSTELLDPRPYLRGHEIVLTVGSTLTDDDTCRTLVRNLTDADASALGFGLGDVVDEVPQALVDACRNSGLPLVTVPRGIPFLSITELLADRRAEVTSARDRQLQRLVATLLHDIAADRDLASLLAHVDDALGGHVTVEDSLVADTQPPDAEVRVALPSGGVLVWRGRADTDVPPDEHALSHLAQVLDVRRHEVDVEKAHDRVDSGRLLRLVVSGRADLDTLDELLRKFGLDSGTITPVCFPRAAATLMARHLEDSLLTEMTWDDDTEVAIVLVADPQEARDIALAHRLPCGIGSSVDAPGLRHAVPESVAALSLAERWGRPATGADLTTFEGLLEQQPSDRLLPFVQTLVLPLVEHDRQHGTHLVATLRAYLAGEGGVNATARELFLHPNSLRHRLARIAELTGRNPLDFDDRVALAVGLWAWDRGRARGVHAGR